LCVFTVNNRVHDIADIDYKTIGYRLYIYPAILTRESLQSTSIILKQERYTIRIRMLTQSWFHKVLLKSILLLLLTNNLHRYQCCSWQFFQLFSLGISLLTIPSINRATKTKSTCPISTPMLKLIKAKGASVSGRPILASAPANLKPCNKPNIKATNQSFCSDKRSSVHRANRKTRLSINIG